VRDYARTHHACDTIVLSAQLESDLIDLSPGEAGEYLRSVGANESGVGALIRSTYQLLGLRTFFTHNETELRAWTVHAGDTAPKAAGVIHTDFERGFIKAEMVPAKTLIDCGSFQAAREKGHYKIEGKDYAVQDGDVLLFKFHV
jgi:ribosome-binding ATPase YchF (GTP1/OBG family)